MKTTGQVFLILGFIFWILSLRGDQSSSIALVFISVGMVYIYSSHKKKQSREEKGNS